MLPAILQTVTRKKEVIQMNKILVGIVVVVIGGIVGWFVLRGDTSLLSNEESTNFESTEPDTQVNETTNPQTTATVLYTDNGFTPESIEIARGTAVTFSNQSSSGAMWVASDAHPTHQLLPGFDALQSMKSGETYTYTFTEVGTWTYHNHVLPADTGTVVVTE